MNRPKVHSFDIETVKFRTPFANQASQSREATSIFFGEFTERIFLLKRSHEQTNGLHWEITHDVTVSECLAFKIGEAEVVIKVLR